jgi:hypothetical protein
MRSSRLLYEGGGADGRGGVASLRSDGKMRRAIRGMKTIASRTTIVTTRSSSATQAAPTLAPSSNANQMRSPAIAEAQPATRGTGRPLASAPPV